jgi:hypothetical protein
MNMKGVWKARYTWLKGKDWVNTLDKDDHQCFTELLCHNSQWGKVGGKARAMTARRDTRGRFVRNMTREEFDQQTDNALRAILGDVYDLAIDIANNPDNTVTHPTAESEYQFFSKYIKGD